MIAPFVICILCLHFPAPPVHAIEVQAAGRVAQLGEFYDAIHEKFLNQLIFSKALPEEMDFVVNTDIPSTTTNFAVAGDLRQKMDVLGISAEMAVSLKLSSFQMDAEGSFSYITSEKQSSKYVEGFLVHKSQTVKESIDLYYEGIRPYVDILSLQETNATHVVAAIYNGADVTAKFTDINTEKADVQDIKGKMEISFNMFDIQIKGSAELNMTDKDFSNVSRYDLEISGDIPINIIPRNAFEVLQFIQDIPSLLQEINDGRGKPLRYLLLPLRELQEAYSLEYMKAQIARQVEDGILNAIIGTFDDISKTRQRLNDLQEEFNAYVDICMRPTLKKKLDSLSNNFDARAGEFTSDIRAAMIAARDEKAGSEEDAMVHLKDVIATYNQDPSSAESVNAAMDGDFDDGRRKIQFYEAFKTHQNLMYLSESSYNADLLDTNETVFYSLFYNLELVDGDTKLWDNSTNLFLTQLPRLNRTKLKVVDCDFPLGHAYCTGISATKIHSFIRNRRVSSDVVRDYFQYNKTAPVRLPSLDNNNPFDPLALYDLGTMYNWKTGEFLDGSSLILPEQTKNVLELEPGKNLRCEIVTSTFQHMFLALNVPHMVQVPLLLGDLRLRGSGQILSVPRNESLERMNLVCEKQSERRVIDVQAKDFPDALDYLALIDNPEGHYFVQAVDYSALSIVSAETLKDLGSSERLRERLQLIKKDLEEGDSTKNFRKFLQSSATYEDISVTVYSDLFQQSQFHAKSDQDIARAFQIIHNMFAEDVKRGVAVYTLYPIASIQLEYGLITEPRHIHPLVTFSGILQFALMFDKLPELRQRVDARMDIYHQYHDCIPVRLREPVEELKKQFYGGLEGWKDQLRLGFQEFRDLGKIRQMEEALVQFEEIEKAGKDILEKVAAVQAEMVDAMKFYDKWRQLGVDYVSSEELIRQSFYKAKDQRAYFLLFKLEWFQVVSAPKSARKSFSRKIPGLTNSMNVGRKVINKSKGARGNATGAWKENEELFMKLFKDPLKSAFVLDCSFFSQAQAACKNVSEFRIHEYKEGLLISGDYLEKEKNGGDEETPLEKLEREIRTHKQDADKDILSFNMALAVINKNFPKFKVQVENELYIMEGKVVTDGNPPPRDFVYRQYKGQDITPEQMWNSTVWKEISIPDDPAKLWKRLV